MNIKNQKLPVKRLKGLDSLFGNEPNHFSQQLPIACIVLPEQQPRRYFDSQKMEQLVQSVKEHGVLEPLLVRVTHQIDIYELVAGERRYRAAKSAGLTEVPVTVRDLSDEEALQIALVENLQREDLNPVEETEGILQLLAFKLVCSVSEVPKLLYRLQNERFGDKANGNVTINPKIDVMESVFTGLGLMSWESFIRNRLPLLKLPTNILESLRQGQIAYTKANVIARVKNEQQRQLLLDEAISKNLSLTQIKELITSMSSSSVGNELIPFKNRIKATYRLVEKSKIWEDPKKQKKLEQLLTEIEALISNY
jgi:ParB family chromosome partitioning protein